VFDWVTHLFRASVQTKESTVDPAFVFHLREELNECEAIYRAAAHLCRRICPENVGGEPSKFQELMIDLHRGLLIKVFVEISDCDRSWNPEECEVALVLLNHVWGVSVDGEHLPEVLRSVAELNATLSWESVLGPFVRIPALADQIGELQGVVTRISNLIAKADGRVLPAEVKRLRSIQATLQRIFTATGEPLERSPAGVAHSTEHAAQLLQSRLPGRHAHERAPRAAANHGGDACGHRASPDRSLAEAMAELNGLIGLEPLKEDIRHLVNFLKVQKQRQAHELPPTRISLHTVFVGNPGTGKTTVARIVARLFAGLQILAKGHTVETDRAGLVAEYAGQTGPKVNKRVDEALGGILFIDEAYSLVAESGDDPYGHEALQVLLKRMEDDRERFVVVLAGYPEPMDALLRSNPGLRSRFQRTFNFPDYNADELLQIFRGLCAKGQYVLTDAARDKLRFLFQTLFDGRDECFGNGRLARNLFERAVGRMANRVSEIAPVTRSLLTTLEADDLQVDDVSSIART
jgi:hypothetical protein